MTRPRDIKVLLVDHEPAVARKISAYLERQGFSVAIDADHDAFDGTTCDCVVVDLTFSSRGRIRMWREVRDRGGIPIVSVITGAQADGAYELGPDYVTTPFLVSEIALRVVVAIRRMRDAATGRSRT